MGLNNRAFSGAFRLGREPKSVCALNPTQEGGISAHETTCISHQNACPRCFGSVYPHKSKQELWKAIKPWAGDKQTCNSLLPDLFDVHHPWDLQHIRRISEQHFVNRTRRACVAGRAARPWKQCRGSQESGMAPPALWAGRPGRTHRSETTARHIEWAFFCINETDRACTITERKPPLALGEEQHQLDGDCWLPVY